MKSNEIAITICNSVTYSKTYFILHNFLTQFIRWTSNHTRERESTEIDFDNFVIECY